MRRIRIPDTMSIGRGSLAPTAPIQAVEAGGIELSNLWRYLAVAMLIAACALLSAWSRVDLVETSYALDMANAHLANAHADQARLELELATLRDPTWLSRAAGELALSNSVPVVDVGGTTGR